MVTPLLCEAGGHRWQRIPPTERRGRVHTSTVTVAVLEAPVESAWRLRDEDIEITTTKDGGPGGQHRNKTESCVLMRHRPTGITAKSAMKSQHQNRRLAREMLEARVAARCREEAERGVAASRRQQVGSGMRGDKIRTYREQDNTVVDHRTGNRAPLNHFLEGQLDLLRC